MSSPRKIRLALGVGMVVASWGLAVASIWIDDRSLSHNLFGTALFLGLPGLALIMFAAGVE